MKTVLLDRVRAVRHGIGPAGRPLLFMPSHGFFRAIWLFLKSLPNKPAGNR